MLVFKVLKIGLFPIKYLFENVLRLPFAVHASSLAATPLPSAFGPNDRHTSDLPATTFPLVSLKT